MVDRRKLRQVAVRHLTGGDTAGRTAVLVATAAVGSSFSLGLMPRRMKDQALLIGVVGATEYGLVLASQYAATAVVRAVTRTRDASSTGPGTRAIATAALMGSGVTLHLLAADRPGESLRRAVARTVGHRVVQVGVARLVVEAADSAARCATRRVHAGPTLRAVAASSARLLGVALASRSIAMAHRVQDPGALPPPTDPVASRPDPARATEGSRLDPLPPIARSVALGTAVALCLEGVAAADALLARRVALWVRPVVGDDGAVAGLVGRAVSLAAVGAMLLTGLRVATRRAEFFGAGVEAAYATCPESESVSGGPSSSIGWRTLSREGVRFVNMALSRQEIAATTGSPLDQVTVPVRAYAGVASAATVDARVDLVMADLEKLGAFQRSVICLASPTGSGYVNYVAVETLEHLTRGNCATVALQYSLRPSFLSIDRVSIGREQNRALLHALRWRLAAIPDGLRPRLVGFGESLGAHTLQDAFLGEGTGGLHRAGIDRALFLGTPATSKWARQWRASPAREDPAGEIVEVASHAEWMTAHGKDRDRHRFFLLSHHEDPVTRFEAALLVQEPTWLGPESHRPPGIPRTTRWRPLTTFLMTGIDMLNALNVVPGTFVARGHDYRADLAQMVSIAFSLPVSDEELRRIEPALRRRELAWAQRRALAEQLERAKETALRLACACGLASSASQ